MKGNNSPPSFLASYLTTEISLAQLFFKVQCVAHGTTKLVRGESCLLTTTASCCSAFFNGLKCSSIGDDGTKSHHILERPREVCSLETAAASLMKCVCVYYMGFLRDLSANNLPLIDLMCVFARGILHWAGIIF